MISSLIDKLFGGKKPQEEKKQQTAVGVVDEMSAGEKEYYLKLALEYAGALMEEGIVADVARNEALDLVAQVILIDKGLERIQRETIMAQMAVLVTRGAVSGAVKRLVEGPGIDEAISAETANLVLSSKEQIDDVCERIRGRLLKQRGEADPGKADLPEEDMKKIEKLKQSMLAQLGAGGGTVYRKQLKRFNADVILEEKNFEKYKKVLFIIDRGLRSGHPQVLEQRVFDLAADFIIATENRNPFERPVIIEKLRRVYRLREWKNEQSEASDGFSEKKRLKYLRRFVEKVEHHYKNEDLGFREVTEKALDEVADEIYNKRWSLTMNREDLKSLIRRWTQSRDIVIELESVKTRANFYRLIQIEKSILNEIPEVIVSYGQIGKLCGRFVKEAKRKGIDSSTVEEAKMRLNQNLVRQFESETNFRKMKFAQSVGSEKMDEVMESLKESDLARLISDSIKLVKSFEVYGASAEKRQWLGLYGVFLRKAIERNLAVYFQPSKMEKQNSAIIKELEEEIKELKLRYESLPEEMKNEKTFRRQRDEQVAGLNRKRKAMLNGDMNALKFFSEHDPVNLARNISWLMTALDPGDTNDPDADWMGRINGMIKEAPAYIRGVNAGWNDFEIRKL